MSDTGPAWWHTAFAVFVGVFAVALVFMFLAKIGDVGAVERVCRGHGGVQQIAHNFVPVVVCRDGRVKNL